MNYEEPSRLLLIMELKIAISSSASRRKKGQLRRFARVAIAQEFEPKHGLLQFLSTIAQFGNELCPRTCAVSFAVVGSDGGSRTEYLISENPTRARVRQRFAHRDDSQSELLRSQPEVLPWLPVIHTSYLIIHTSSARPILA